MCVCVCVEEEWQKREEEGQRGGAENCKRRKNEGVEGARVRAEEPGREEEQLRKVFGGAVRPKRGRERERERERRKSEKGEKVARGERVGGSIHTGRKVGEGKGPKDGAVAAR